MENSSLVRYNDGQRAEIVLKVCELYQSGEYSLTEAVKSATSVTYQTIKKWIKQVPECKVIFAKAHKRHRASKMKILEELALEGLKKKLTGERYVQTKIVERVKEGEDGKIVMKKKGGQLVPDTEVVGVVKTTKYIPADTGAIMKTLVALTEEFKLPKDKTGNVSEQNNYYNFDFSGMDDGQIEVAQKIIQEQMNLLALNVDESINIDVEQ